MRQIVYQYFVTTGKPIDESKLFQQELPDACWKNVENFISALKRLPLWINKDHSLSHFGAKRNNDYWQSIFESGCTPDDGRVMPSGLNLLEMIRGEE